MYSKPAFIILTGPPGSGKTTCYKEFHHHLPLVDIDKYHGSHTERKRKRKEELKKYLSKRESFVFTTGAPTREQKEFWYKLGIAHGFQPILVAFAPPRMLAYKRHKQRGHHDRLQRGIERWYRLYTRHTREYRLQSSNIRADYARALSGHGAFEAYRQWEESYDTQEPPLHEEGGGAGVP